MYFIEERLYLCGRQFAPNFYHVCLQIGYVYSLQENLYLAVFSIMQ